MEEKKTQDREPYRPNDTPEPPQHMDPRERMEHTQDNKKNASPENAQPKKEENKTKTEKPKLLGESETEIDDETTI